MFYRLASLFLNTGFKQWLIISHCYSIRLSRVHIKRKKKPCVIMAIKCNTVMRLH